MESTHKKSQNLSPAPPSLKLWTGFLALPQVIWHFGARELSPTNGRKMEENGSNYSLVLAGVQGEAELGNYTCEAINKMGEGRDTALLTGGWRSLKSDGKVSS